MLDPVRGALDSRLRLPDAPVMPAGCNRAACGRDLLQSLALRTWPACLMLVFVPRLWQRTLQVAWCRVALAPTQGWSSAAKSSCSRQATDCCSYADFLTKWRRPWAYQPTSGRASPTFAAASATASSGRGSRQVPERVPEQQSLRYSCRLRTSGREWYMYRGGQQCVSRREPACVPLGCPS